MGFASPTTSPLTIVQYEYAVDGDSILLGFGDDARRLRPVTPEAVQDVLRQWLPDVEVVDATAHDWVDDPFSRQTWAMLRPGQLTKGLAALKSRRTACSSREATTPRAGSDSSTEPSKAASSLRVA